MRKGADPPAKKKMGKKEYDTSLHSGQHRYRLNTHFSQFKQPGNVTGKEKKSTDKQRKK